VPDDVKALVEQEKQKIIDPANDTIFCGPLKGATTASEFVAAGQCLTDPELLSMDWFVEGVKGDAPKQAPEPDPAGEPAPQPACCAKPFKAAFVYVGPTGDLGWSYAHDQGRLCIEPSTLGVETAYSELVAEGPDAARVIRDFAEKGYDIIFATSFGYMDSVIEVAPSIRTSSSNMRPAIRPPTTWHLRRARLRGLVSGGHGRRQA
jgi:hypothetical protein